MKSIKKFLGEIPHKNSCGRDLRDIECGGDLGGDDNEFAQCSTCREKDYLDYFDIKGFISIEEVKKIIDECDGILCKWVNLDRISWNVAHYEFLKNLKKRLEK